MGDPSESLLAGDNEDGDDEEGLALASFLESELLDFPGNTAPDHLSHPADKGKQEERGNQLEGVVKSGKGYVKNSSKRMKKEDGGEERIKRMKKRRQLGKEKQLEKREVACAQKDIGMGQQSYQVGNMSMVPLELLFKIFKFLSSEDLVSCSLVCRFMNLAASDEALWRRLYCMRWGFDLPSEKMKASPWKHLYMERDKNDMAEFVRNTPTEFRQYYIQVQASKRCQAPLPSQVNDDQVILERTVADKVSIWKTERGFTNDTVMGHVCSGSKCKFTKIGDSFICEDTGRVHVCGDMCREVVCDEESGVFVCMISGQCFDNWISLEEDSDPSDLEEAEPFMGIGRYARAYLLGYNCADEKELKAALRNV